MTNKFLIFLALVFFIVSCSKSNKNYTTYGETITDANTVFVNQISSQKKFNQSPIKITAIVNQVCQSKGCWMTLENDDNETIRVKFKDYGFFVPKDIAGKEVIVEGVITEKELDLESAKHYAEDANIPFDSSRTYREFELIASGVLLSN